MKSVLRLLGKLNIFRDMRITAKLALVSALLVLGFTAVVGAYLYQQQIVAGVEAQREVLDTFATASNNVETNVLTGEAALRAFLLTQSPTARSTLDTAINAANNNMAELETLAQNERQQSVIDQLRDAISAYQRAVAAAIGVYEIVGLDQDSGLRGEKRVAVHDIESLLSKYDEPQLTISMLQMRRHEKDFLEREDGQYVEKMAQEQDNFQQLLAASKLPSSEKAQITAQMTAYDQAFQSLAAEIINRAEAVEVADRQEALVNPLVSSLAEVTAQTEDAVRRLGEARIEQVNRISLGVLVAVGVIVGLTLIFLALGIGRSLRRLRSAVVQVTEGNLEARAEMTTRDELGQFGNAFDNMLNERVADLAKQAKENDQLNDSVIVLMDAADRLSKRDLTVVLPVGEDITGNVSDALNQMTRHTATTMAEINSVAAQLERVASAVRDQTEKVGSVATAERQVVAKTLLSLEQSAVTMDEIVQLAGSTNELANTATLSGRKALGAVRTTVQSMGEIRSSVGETEKSIKRLGERSQEIGAIVEIIKDIAERTHTLALNAGMQAVAAGEAGRGFSVVADEVQRLAETARESTSQINVLVQSIQAESSESMATMNQTIKQVVQGSELAERAGKRMRITQQSSQELVESVARIAERARLLETTNKDLQQQAMALQESTEATKRELQAQAEQTSTMFRFLQSLVQSVRVFKLPEAA